MPSSMIKFIFSFAEIKNRCPPNQLKQLHGIMNKHSQYKARVALLPEKLPPINWDYYRKNVRAEALPLVDEYEKKYKDLKIPYPIDKYSELLAKMKDDTEKDIKKHSKKSNKNIEMYQKEIDKLKAMMPYTEMTMQDFCENHPNISPDFINKPTFWPHTEDEQLGYVEPIDIKAAESKKLALDPKASAEAIKKSTQKFQDSKAKEKAKEAKKEEEEDDDD